LISRDRFKTVFLIVIISVFALFILPLSPALLQESNRTRTYPTNLDLVQKALSQAANKTLQFVPQERRYEILLQSAQNQGSDWLIEGALAKLLTQSGYRVILKKGESSSKEGEEVWSGEMDTVIVFYYRTINLGVIYQKIWQKGLWGKRYVDRAAQAKIHLSLRDSESGRVIAIGEVDGSAADTVPEEFLPLLEDNLISPTKLFIKESHFNRILEPLLVSGVVGGLIYLFYSSRATK